MTRELSSVVLVLDDTRLNVPALGDVPIWMVDAPRNAAVARELWAAGHANVRLISRDAGESESALFRRAAETIDEHHGPASGSSYARLVVYGLSASMFDVLDELSLTVIGREGDAHILK